MVHYTELALQAVDLGESARVSLTLTMPCEEHISHTVRRELDMVYQEGQLEAFTWARELLNRVALEAMCCGEGYELVVLNLPTKRDS